MIATLLNRTRAAARVLVGKPPQGRIVEFDPNLDTLRADLTTGLTFTKLRALLDPADQGDITETLQLFENMERGDPRLYSVANTRRLALTGLDWEIVSAADVGRNVEDKNLADEAAAYAREKFDRIEGLDCALEHLATAIGPNLAVFENVWESTELVDMVSVPHWRLTMDLRKSTDIRVITAEERVYGIVADAPKFVVHIPNAKSGSPLSNSLARAQAMLWLIKRLALADWAKFCELFGIPLRVATYQSNASPEEKRMLIDMMKNLGSAAWATVTGAVKIEFVESSQRGTAPFEALLNFCTRETGILWLGGNLTSDTTGGTGTFAGATVQDDVPDDLRNDDIKREGRTVRDQVIHPIVMLGFPGRDVPVPYFRCIKPETIDRIKEAELMSKAQHIGMDVPEAWARERIGVPKPKVDEHGKREAVLEAPDAFEDSIREGFDGP